MKEEEERRRRAEKMEMDGRQILCKQRDPWIGSRSLPGSATEIEVYKRAYRHRKCIKFIHYQTRSTASGVDRPVNLVLFKTAFLSPHHLFLVSLFLHIARMEDL